MRRSPVLASFAALLAIAAAACTGDGPGQATGTTPQTTVGTTETSAGASSTPYTPPVDPNGKTASLGTGIPTDSIQPRPRELPLDDVEPCDLFTGGQLKQLEVTRTRSTISKSEHFRGMRVCSMEAGDPSWFFNYYVTAVTTEGIEEWLTGLRNVDAWVVSVGEYAAVDYKLFGTERGECVTAVDVAEGQYLSVWMDPGSSREHSQDELCAMSERAAGMALENLQQQK